MQVKATLRRVIPCFVLVSLAAAPTADRAIAQEAADAAEGDESVRAAAAEDGADAAGDAGATGALAIHYLEIVTPDVDATCDLLASVYGSACGEPAPEFGGARMIALAGGGRLGVRAPLREGERLVTRPYVLVSDIDVAVEAAQAAGGEFAVLPTEIPGEGRFAIYFLGETQYGLWER